MFERYTERARRVIFFARNAAAEAGLREIGPAQIALAIVQVSPLVLREIMGRDRVAELEATLSASKAEKPTSVGANLPMSRQSHRVLTQAADISEDLGQRAIGPVHLLLGILETDGATAGLMEPFNLTHERVRNYLKRQPPLPELPGGAGFRMAMGAGGGQMGSRVGALFGLVTKVPEGRWAAAARILQGLCDDRVEIAGTDSQGSFTFKFDKPPEAPHQPSA